MGGLFQTTPEEMQRMWERGATGDPGGVDVPSPPASLPKFPATGRLAMLAPDGEGNSTLVAQAVPSPRNPPDLAQDNAEPPKEPTYRTITGGASYYDKGKITAYGEPFDPTKLTAAMRDRALRGKEVIVRLADRPERSVRVRINDRGPWAVDEAGRALKPRMPHPTRVIDLSKRAFEDLMGNTDAGTANVEILIPNED